MIVNLKNSVTVVAFSTESRCSLISRDLLNYASMHISFIFKYSPSELFDGVTQNGVTKQFGCSLDGLIMRLFHLSRLS